MAAATVKALAAGREVIWVPAQLASGVRGVPAPAPGGLAPPPGVTGRPGVAAFDFDGTLVPGDSLPRFLALGCWAGSALPGPWPGRLRP